MLTNFDPANIYLFKINNRNARKRCKICSKLIIKTPERRQPLFPKQQNILNDLCYFKNYEIMKPGRLRESCPKSIFWFVFSGIQNDLGDLEAIGLGSSPNFASKFKQI